jgi:glycine/D-amino acid oxidase-like deaminating enzyme
VRRETTFDAVVVGAGALGASVAFHLQSSGRGVALADRTAFAAQNSPRAAGLAVQVRTSHSFSEIARRSVDAIAGFERETGIPLRFDQTGSVAMARTEVAAERVRDHPSLGARNGIESVLIDPAEAARLAPYADTRAALAISYTPSDLHLEPGDLPRAYIAAALERGLTPLEGVEVRELLVEEGHAVGVDTSAGRVEAPVVVLCAGPWTSLLTERLGVPLPVLPVRHQLMVTEPLADVERTHASFRVVDANVYARPCWGGLMFGGYEDRPKPAAAEDLPRDLALFEPDPAPLEELRARVERELPVLRDARVRVVRGGYPTLTADGHFVIDELRGALGAYFVTGCNVGGLSTAPATGEDVARWIAGGRRPRTLDAFRADRFDGWVGRAHELRARAEEQYARTEYG